MSSLKPISLAVSLEPAKRRTPKPFLRSESSSSEDRLSPGRSPSSDNENSDDSHNGDNSDSENSGSLSSGPEYPGINTTHELGETREANVGREVKGNNNDLKRKRSEDDATRNVKRKFDDFELPEGYTKKIVKKNEDDEGYVVYYTPGGRPYRSLKKLIVVIKNQNYKPKAPATTATGARRGRPPKKKRGRPPKIPKAESKSAKTHLSPDELQQSFENEEKVAGKNWINRKVECYWAYPATQRGFYPGIIRQVRRAEDDIEYLVEYIEAEGVPKGHVPGPEWEVPDEGMRFATKEHMDELKKVVEIRRHRGTLTEVQILPRPKGKEAKRARVGTDYQVDESVWEVLKSKKNHEDEKQEKRDMGTCAWRPDMLKPAQVESFLKKTKTSHPVPNPFSRSAISLEPSPNLITKEEAFSTLHKSKYDLNKTLTSLKVKFEVAMKMNSKNFSSYISKLRDKTLAEIIEFYWYWRSSPRFEEWTLAKTQMANYFQRALFLKQDQSRNPRLRQRVRIDYSDERPWTGLTDADFLKVLKYATRPKGDPEKEKREILVFDIKVYADVYFPEDDEKACNNYVLKWREQEKDRIEEEREMEYGSHSSSADFFDESS